MPVCGKIQPVHGALPLCEVIRYEEIMELEGWIKTVIVATVGLLLGLVVTASPERAMALGTVGASVILAQITLLYVYHTKRMADTANRELELRIQPLTRIETQVHDVDPNGDPVFQISLVNRGKYHIRITGCEITWSVQNFGAFEPTASRSLGTDWIEPGERGSIRPTLQIEKNIKESEPNLSQRLRVHGRVKFKNRPNGRCYIKQFNHPPTPHHYDEEAVPCDQELDE